MKSLPNSNRYQVILSSQVRSALEALTPALRVEVRDNLYQLQASPVSLSRPSAPPYEPPGKQVYRFAVQDNGTQDIFTAVFEYHNEVELHVLALGQVTRGS